MLDELKTEDTGLEELNLEAPLELRNDDIPGVRAVMIRLQQLDADEDRVKATKAAVVASYDEQLARIERDRNFLRPRGTTTRRTC